MAIQLDYTDDYGDQYPASYWRRTQINLNFERRTGGVSFVGYQDKDRKGGRPIGTKDFPVTPELFETYFGGNKDTFDVEALAYMLAKESADTDKGAKDAGGKTVLESFFKGGKDV